MSTWDEKKKMWSILQDVANPGGFRVCVSNADQVEEDDEDLVKVLEFGWWNGLCLQVQPIWLPTATSYSICSLSGDSFILEGVNVTGPRMNGGTTSTCKWRNAKSNVDCPDSFVNSCMTFIKTHGHTDLHCRWFTYVLEQQPSRWFLQWLRLSSHNVNRITIG